MDIKKQIAELQKKGFTKSQAGIIALQQGGSIINNVPQVAPRENYDQLRALGITGSTPYLEQATTGITPRSDYEQLRALALIGSTVSSETAPSAIPERSNYDQYRAMAIRGSNPIIEKAPLPTSQLQYQNYRKQLASMQQGGGFNVSPFTVPQTSSDYTFQYPNINNTPYSYNNNMGEEYINRNPLPNFGNNGFQYNPNTIDTSPIVANTQTQVNPLAADAGSGISSYQEPTYNQNFNNFDGGYSLENSLRIFGQGLGEHDANKIAMGGTLSALKSGRIGLGGYAFGKENKRVEDEYRRKLYEDNRAVTNLQQGGSTKDLKNADIMTGQYLVENPNGGNVNIESGEQVKDNQTGNIQEAVGESHKNGGISVNAEDSKVLSDFTKIGAKNAKQLKERYNLSLKKTDTFAKVMDKVNKKIGIDKLTEEQAKAIEKLGDNEYIKDQTTKILNEKLLTKQVEDSQEKLDTLKGAQNFAFEDIFALQEAIPKKGNGELINPDGSKMEINESKEAQGIQNYQQGGHIYELAKKYNISPERVEELMLQQGGETMQEQAPQNDQVSQIIQAFAQATQQDPQVIVEQLQQLPQEEQQQALQQMVQQLQQQSSQEQQMPEETMMQQGGYSFSTRYMPQSKDYVTKGSSILDQDVLSGVEEFQPFTGKGYGAKMADVAKTIDTHSWYFDTDKKKKDFAEAVLKKGKQPEIVAFQEAYNKELEKRANSAGVPQTEIDSIKKEVGFSDKGIQKVDGLFGAFTSTRPLYNFSKNNGEVVARPEFNQGEVVENITPAYRDNTVGFQPYITPPSSRKGVILETVQSPQYDRVKRAFEQGEASIASQADTKRQQVEATGLAPQIQEAIMAGDLATSQGASNQNIASVEGFNAQNQQQVNQLQENADFKTNLFNLGARDQYFVRNTQAQDNAEIAQKMYNDSYNRLGYQNQADLMNRNLVNATSDNYAVNANGTITFKAPSSYYNNADNSKYYAWYDKLTPTDQEFERRRLAQETLDRANANKKENASKIRKF